MAIKKARISSFEDFRRAPVSFVSFVWVWLYFQFKSKHNKFLSQPFYACSQSPSSRNLTAHDPTLVDFIFGAEG
jgi:hypothetical protein